MRCQKYFTVQPHSFSTQDQYILGHHLDGIPYRKLCRTYKKTKDTLNKIVNKMTSALIRNNELTAQLCPIYEDGIFLADGKFFRCKRLVMLPSGKVTKRKYPKGRCQVSIMHWATHDIAVTTYGDTEDETLWLKVWQSMKELGIKVRFVVADDKSACARALKRVFPQITLQTCHAHFTREIEKKLCFRHVERRLSMLGKEIERLAVSLARLEMNAWKLRAVKLANDMAEIEYTYHFLFEFVALVKDLLQSRTMEEKGSCWKIITQEWFPLYESLAPNDPHQKKIRRMWRKVVDKEDELFAYLKFPNEYLPKTTNALEGWHNQLELRCNSIRGFESPESGDNYLNALTLWRRFRPYTDCKGVFKHLNGQSPLGATGVKVKSIQNWISHCLKK